MMMITHTNSVKVDRSLKKSACVVCMNGLLTMVDGILEEGLSASFVVVQRVSREQARFAWRVWGLLSPDVAIIIVKFVFYFCTCCVSFL